MSVVRSVDAFIKKYMPLLILGVLIAGYLVGLQLSRPVIHAIKSSILPSVILMIYAMLITMRMEDLTKALVYPKEMLYGSFMSLFVAPLLMIPLAMVFAKNPHLYTGLILAGIVPPGGMITYWTGILNANIGLATAIQTVTFLVAIIWVPYGMKLLVGSKVAVDVGLLLNKILILVVVPLVLALITQKLITRKYGWKGIMQIKPLCHLVSSVMALYMVFVATSVQAHTIARHPAVIALPAVGVFIYYLLAYPFSYFLSTRVFRMSFENAIPVTYGFSTKNLSIAMGLAVAAFGPMAFLGVVPCALFQMPFASVWYKVFSRWSPMPQEGPVGVAVASPVQGG